MTLLITPRTVIEAFLSVSREVPLRDIYDTGNLAGLSDQAVRLAIRRLIAAGDVTQHGRGRSGTLQLTPEGNRRLQHDRRSLSLALAQDEGRAPWSGRWHLIAVSIPEQDRAIRDTLRRDLLEVGARAISTGLYVSPHDLRSVLREDATSYLSTATSTDLNLHGQFDPQAIAESLWPAAPILTAYKTLEEAVGKKTQDKSLPGIVRQLYLAEAIEGALRNDPLLPLELRADPWIPSGIRLAWSQQWRDLGTAAGDYIYQDWPVHAATGGGSGNSEAGRANQAAGQTDLQAT